MNANELANLLEVDSWYKLVTREEIASMLRQLQAENEALKANFNKENPVKEVFNKPVAWMCQNNVTDEWEFSSMKHCNKCEPLYTHPVKDLEDIEINITWNETSMRDFGKEELAFARAILRKASEK